ncbi:PEP/pyruvate-binding domain-containing protein, partial [Dyella sp.]|uniref:PEP/pyruvate-binding domain-containing protein n=1 Tax=Dyella sp. TaxID=1869338 RepID=UPI002D769D5E
MNDLVLWLDHLRMTDLGKVGGKNASLGEMIGNLAKLGVSVPGGFATTADAFQQYLDKSGVAARIQARLANLDVDDVDALTTAGREIRSWVVETPLPQELDQAIRQAYVKLCEDAGSNDIAVAVRSSATAEDLPDASFAGQQETFLNIRGASGVMFTLDTESGFRDVVFITSSWGLGELVVQGAVNPDEFYVHKPMLAAGKPAILRRRLGSKLQKMTFSTEASAGKSVRTENLPPAERDRFSLT